MVRVPFMDLAAHHRSLAPAFRKKFNELLRTSEFILGSEVEAFEKEFAAYLGTRHAVGVSNGTDALRLAFEAIGLRPGEEVIVPAHTYISSALAVTFAGGVPRFVDVLPDTFTLDPARIEEAVTPKTRAILAVHLYGHPAEMDPILEIARRRGLRVVEDCAQAHGTTYRGRRVGGFGDASGFSFYPSKNLGALGDGGAVTTNDDGIAEKLRALRHLGQRRKNVHEIHGHNNRLDGLQAAFLRIKLKRLEGWNRRRQAAAARYAKELKGTGATLPVTHPGCTHVYHLYTVLHPRREEVRKALESAAIASGVYYPTPVPFQECYRGLGHRPGSFPVTERLSATSLSVPLFPEITPAQIRAVGRAFRRAVRPP